MLPALCVDALAPSKGAQLADDVYNLWVYIHHESFDTEPIRG